MPTLYVSDLDGTLLGPNAGLSAYSRTVLHELLDQGLNFTVASARSVVSMRAILRGLPFRLPIIASNGAFVTDFHTGRHEVVNAIDREVVREIHALILAHQQVPFISSHAPGGDRLYYSVIANPGMQHFLDDRVAARDPRLRAIARSEDGLDEQVVCITVIGNMQPLTALEQAIREHCAAQVETHLVIDPYSGWPWLTIHDHRASKDQAVRALVQNHGLQEKEVVVFGDEINDIKMFCAADRALAVSNAVDAVKQVATSVIGRNVDDGVVQFIQADWRGATRPPGSQP